MLPDEVLLEIFYFWMDGNERMKKHIEAWQTLVHVCRRWRSVVFASPRRLDLQLACTERTRTRDMLDIWPALPLAIQCYADFPVENVDNIVAVLERSNRVRHIFLKDVSSSRLETVLAEMQGPFLELRTLHLLSFDKTVPVLPDSFLGGSAPRLQILRLYGIPFPGLPNLLLSATHLVDLYLINIPHSGYVSPEAMVITLSTLTSLEELRLEFESPRSRPDRASRHSTPATRFAFPSLTFFWFKGAGQYLDDLVARTDAPRLFLFDITFFNQVVFDTPQLIQFINRTPKLKALKKARVIFEDDAARAKFSSRTSRYGELKVRILCRELNGQVSSLQQVCSSCLPRISRLQDLYIYGDPLWKPDRRNNVGNTPWLELLRPFTGVKNLYLSEDFARHIVPSLRELVGGRATEALPALRNVFLEGLQTRTSGSVQEGIRRFIAARQASRPITVSRWDRGRTRGRLLINTFRLRSQ